MADDLTCLCREYYDYICSELGTEPAWFFPALDPERPLANTAVDRRFNDAWKKTSYAACCNDKPVVHDLRFTFVTNRINQWIEAGEDINVLLPTFLCTWAISPSKRLIITTIIHLMHQE